MSPAAEWLLDNFHVISAAARDIQHDLPPSFFRRLPRVAADEFAGLPRIYALALELIGSSAGRLDAQRLQRFISAFQSVTPLTIGELWAWPSALKLALIDHLRERGDVLAATRAHRLAADRLASAIEVGARAAPASGRPRSTTRSSRACCSARARSARSRRRCTASSTRRWRARGETIEDAIRADGQHQAAEQAGVANLISSLRLIATFDWSEFFESVSLVEQVLQRDPAGVYSRMDFRSRDRYRHAVEELARADRRSAAAARAEERRARAAGARAHAGRPRGARRLPPDWRRPPAVRAQRRLAARRQAARAAAVLRLGHARSTSARSPRARRCSSPRRSATPARHGWRGAALAFVALLTVVPASELVIQLLQRLISYLIPPRRLPRIELDARAAVGPDDGDRADAARQRRARRGADRAPRSAGARQPRPAHPLRPAQRLSGRRRPRRSRRTPRSSRRPAPASPRSTPSTPTAGADRFFLFHRLRQWNEREGLWMGWERKRGKIEEFNRLLRGATDTSFAVSVGDLSMLPDVKYCITLDSDTRLPRGVARELIGIIVHPLNRADVRSAGRPRHRGLRHPAAAHQRHLHERGRVAVRPALFRAHRRRSRTPPRSPTPIRTCSARASSPARASTTSTRSSRRSRTRCRRTRCCRTTCSRACTRASALVSDVELVDDYPSSVLSHARRQHRWVRGDWQILFWLFPFVPSRRGLKRNPLPIDRPLEDPRQPAPQPGGADAAGAARRRLDGAARAALGLDGDRWSAWRRRSCCRCSRGC